MQTLTRRTLLSRAVRCAAAGSLLRFGVPAPAASAQGATSTRDLGRGLHVVTLAATNVVAASGSDGLMLVDGAPTGQAADLAAQLAALPSTGKVHTLFNTHWHPEQTGSNESLADAGAAIIAQRNTKLWLSTDVTWPWNDETVEPLPKAARPTKTFFDRAEYEIDGRKVRCGHLRDCPHTDGDLYVFFPDDNVLAVGDAVYGAGWPSIDWWTGGWIGGLVGGLDMLLTVADEDTRVVPARGPVLTRKDLSDQHEMYGVVWERLLRTLYGGGGPKEALAGNPAKEFEGERGPSDAFVTRAFESLWAYLSPDA